MTTAMITMISMLTTMMRTTTCAKTQAASLRSSSPLPLSANTSTTKRAPRASRNCLEQISHKIFTFLIFGFLILTFPHLNNQT